MSALFKNLPLSVRLILAGAMFSFNLVLFPFVSLMMVVPFCGMDRATAIFTGHFLTDADKYIFLFAQVVSSLGTFGLTALLMSQLETGHVARRLALKVMPTLKLIAIALIGVLAAQGLIQFLVEVNQKIPLPNSLKFLAEQGKQSEELMNGLLKGNSIILFLCNAIALAVTPAIAEEFFFRGFLLGDLAQIKTQPHSCQSLSQAFYSPLHICSSKTFWLFGLWALFWAIFIMYPVACGYPSSPILPIIFY